MAYLILANGSALEVTPNDNKKFTLEELNDFVGGYIEKISLPYLDIYCDEEGKLKNLPVNYKATNILREAYKKLGRQFNDVIVGDVLICAKK